jgi:hypothetical protein
MMTVFILLSAYDDEHTLGVTILMRRASPPASFMASAMTTGTPLVIVTGLRAAAPHA